MALCSFYTSQPRSYTPHSYIHIVTFTFTGGVNKCKQVSEWHRIHRNACILLWTYRSPFVTLDMLWPCVCFCLCLSQVGVNIATAKWIELVFGMGASFDLSSCVLRKFEYLRKWGYFSLKLYPKDTHTHTHPFNGPLSRTAWVGRYQSGFYWSKRQWVAVASAWSVCTSLQTDNHASTPPLSFLRAGCPSCHPTNSVKALKAKTLSQTLNKISPQPVNHRNMSST